RTDNERPRKPTGSSWEPMRQWVHIASRRLMYLFFLPQEFAASRLFPGWRNAESPKWPRWLIAVMYGTSAYLNFSGILLLALLPALATRFPQVLFIITSYYLMFCLALFIGRVVVRRRIRMQRPLVEKRVA